MPAFLALAFIYGVGMNSITNKFKNMGNLFFILLIIISASFVGTEIFKFKLARQSWNFYQKDFGWIKADTLESSIIMAGGQCMSFYFDRLTLWPKNENIEKVDYAFVNQDFKVDELRSKTPEDVLEEIRKNRKLVYENKETKTEIYKIKDQFSAKTAITPKYP